MKNISKILIAASVVFTVSCDPEFDHKVSHIEVTSGDADFSKYIALGNSLAAGFTDNALFIDGQENSYPNLMAQQMARAGGGSFSQPLMPDNIGGFTNLGVPGKLHLVLSEGGLAPVPTPAEAPLTPAGNGPYGNMGVPGAKSFHLLAPGYGDPAGIGSYANPYFVRFASSPTTSVLADAAAQSPTFFSLWIGNNDVLSYATSGGLGVDQAGNPDVTTYGSNDITDPQVVAGSIKGILDALVIQGGARGVIANIPSVTDIPYFTTVPYNPLDPSNPAFGPMIPQLNALFGQLNMVFDAVGQPGRKIQFDVAGPSAVVIFDKDLEDIGDTIATVLVNAGLDPMEAALYGMTYGQARQATEDDMVVFPASAVVGQVDEARVATLVGMGVPTEQAIMLSVAGITYPLQDQWVLTQKEAQKVATATNAYNAAIAQLAADYDLAFVDAKGAMQSLSSVWGITYNGQNYNSTYVSGSAFSLDAVHLTGQGYAVVANYFINAINAKYGSTLPTVNPINYPGFKIP